MTTSILGAYTFSDTPDVNGIPVQLVGQTAGVIRSLNYVEIPVLTGTTRIPEANTPPLITQGTQISSIVITPTAVDSKFIINIAPMVSTNTKTRAIIMTLWRDSTLIAVGGQMCNSANRPYSLSLHKVDLPATISPVTYSIRIGVNTNGPTWRISQSSVTFGGQTQTWSLMEI